MKVYYEKIGKNVFDYLPVTFHVKRFNDESWKQFSIYYFQDAQKHKGERRLWIVKPGQNSNRGSGITIHSDYQKIKELVFSQLSEKKTFIIQKYIDKPFLYNKRKFDIRCYMLLVRLVYLALSRMKELRDIGMMKDIFEQVALNFSSTIPRISLFI